MNFDEIKEQILSRLKELWDRIQDSSAYNQARDRFENLTPQMQRLTLAGLAAFVALMILSIPYSYWSSSQSNIEGFEGRRKVVRELLAASREASDVPDIPVPPSPDNLKTEIDAQLQQMSLLPEQIKAVNTSVTESSLIPATLAQGGVSVMLAKLNLKQIVDIGYKLKALNPSVKMTSMDMIPNKEDGRYFDVTFKLISLAVPQAAPPPLPEVEEPAAGKRPTFRKPPTSKSKDLEE